MFERDGAERIWLFPESNYNLVSSGIQVLTRALRSYVSREMASKHGPGWLNKAEETIGRSIDTDEEGTPTDLSNLLHIMIRDEAFDGRFDQAERSIVYDLIRVRNRWAHQGEFSTNQTYGALDSIRRLLIAIDAPEGEDVEEYYRQALDAHHQAIIGAREPTLGFDHNTGGWRRRNDTVLEITTIPHGLRDLRIAEAGVEAFTIAQDDQEVSFLTRTWPSGVSRPRVEAGDVLVVIDREKFHQIEVPLSITIGSRDDGAVSTVSFKIRLGLGNLARFARKLTRLIGYGDVSGRDLGWFLSSDDVIHHAVARALADSSDHDSISPEIVLPLLEPVLDTDYGLHMTDGPISLSVRESRQDPRIPHEGMIISSQDSGTSGGKQYRLIREIGRGDFGIVYYGEPHPLREQEVNPEVAVKIVTDWDRIRFARHELEHVIRAQDEMENRGTVHRIARIVDWSPGPPFAIISRFIPGPAHNPPESIERGETLRDFMSNRDDQPLEPEQATEIICEVLEALEAIHAVGLIHRDLHPGNIIMPQGKHPLRLIDFGLAWAPPRGDDSSYIMKSVAGVIPPHPFAEPGYRLGDRFPDAKTDLYSVGILLWWLLSGRDQLPVGRTLEQVLPDAPSGLLQAIERACVRNRSDGVGSAAEMRIALGHQRGPVEILDTFTIPILYQSYDFRLQGTIQLPVNAAHPGRLAGPSQLAFASDGTLYIVDGGVDPLSLGDMGSDRVRVVAPTGKDIGAIGQPIPVALGQDVGWFQGGFRGLTALTIDGCDRILAVDHPHNYSWMDRGNLPRLQIFSRDGELLNQIDSGLWLGRRPNHAWLEEVHAHDNGLISFGSGSEFYTLRLEDESATLTSKVNYNNAICLSRWHDQLLVLELHKDPVTVAFYDSDDGRLRQRIVLPLSQWGQPRFIAPYGEEGLAILLESELRQAFGSTLRRDLGHVPSSDDGVYRLSFWFDLESDGRWQFVDRAGIVQHIHESWRTNALMVTSLAGDLLYAVELHPSPTQASGFAVRPDGKVLVSSFDEGLIYLYEPEGVCLGIWDGTGDFPGYE